MTDSEVIKLVNPREFIAAWFNALPHHPTYLAAYESIECEYERVFGKRKYSSWESFVIVKRRITQVQKK